MTDAHDVLEDALQRIVQWAEAYPLTVFPEPDFRGPASCCRLAA